MKKLIFLGFLSFVMASILFIPLAFLTPHLSKITTDVTFEEPEGTIWNGKVNNLTIKNNFLGKATWRVNALKSLKSLSLKSDFTLKSNDINASGFAGLNLNKELLIENTQFDINAEYLNTLQSNAKLSGSINGFIENALIIQNVVPSIKGIINWQDGSLDAPIKLDKGDYRAELKPEGQNLDIKLSSKEAPIELNGDIKLQNDWVFNTNLVTKSNNLGLMTMMKFAGKAQTDGTILIKQTGDLKPFIGLK